MNGLCQRSSVLRLARPESLVVRGRLGAQRGDVGGLQAGLGGEFGGGGKRRSSTRTDLMFWLLMFGCSGARRIPYELFGPVNRNALSPVLTHSHPAISGEVTCVSGTWLLLLALGPATAFAWGDGCKFRADRAGGVDAKGVEKVVIRAGAGDMKVVGRGNAVRIEARGVACAAKQELLDATQITVRREGNVVYVETTLPQDDDNWSFGQATTTPTSTSASRCRRTFPVEAIDSSGDATFEDLKCAHAAGQLRRPRRSSASPALADVGDSSGDIDIEGAGSVRAARQLRRHRGRGRARRRGRDARQLGRHPHRAGRRQREACEQDSSGGIRVEDVKGNVIVDSDSSGDIYAGRVGGDFTVSDDSSGTIEHESISGKVTCRATSATTTTTWNRRDSSGGGGAAAAARAARPAGAASARSCGGRRKR